MAKRKQNKAGHVLSFFLEPVLYYILLHYYQKMVCIILYLEEHFFKLDYYYCRRVLYTFREILYMNCTDLIRFISTVPKKEEPPPFFIYFLDFIYFYVWIHGT